MVVCTLSWHSETVTFTLHMKGCRAAKMTLKQRSEAARKAGLAVGEGEEAEEIRRAGF